MRTTLTLDEALVKKLKEEAARSGRSFKEVVNETLRWGLRQKEKAPRPKPYRLAPSPLGRARAGIDLDKALRLSDALEDEERDC